MNEHATQYPGPRLSLRRIAALLVPAAVAVVVAAVVLSRGSDPLLTSGNRRIDQLLLSTFHVKPPAANRLDRRFQDADGDLVADVPTDPDEWIDPAPLGFTYIASREPEQDRETWRPLVEHLAARLEREVEYRHFDTIELQLDALRQGELHVCGLNTGSVPLAVNAYGFVPLCTYGSADGSFGYRMQIVVLAGSKIRSLHDLGRDHVFAFTHPSSNSGFKAPLVLLMSEYRLQPERDYRWAMAGGHDAALRGVCSTLYDAAAVASDMLNRSAAAGDVKQDQLRVIYESERYPSAAIGRVYNLQPQLAEKLRAALLDFSFAGTMLAERLGAAGSDCFVPVTYKDDWALIRRNDDALGAAQAVNR